MLSVTSSSVAPFAVVHHAPPYWDENVVHEIRADHTLPCVSAIVGAVEFDRFTANAIRMFPAFVAFVKVLLTDRPVVKGPLLDWASAVIIICTAS